MLGTSYAIAYDLMIQYDMITLLERTQMTWEGGKFYLETSVLE